jgi:hypothetical protein
MKLQQLSLFLENKPGALSTPVKLLAEAKINLLALTMAEAQHYGILRLVVRDWKRAKSLLEKRGLAVKVTDVLAIEVADRPGGLAEILTVLEGAGINLEYMYAFTLKRDSRGLLLFRFDDPDKAIGVLQMKNINVVGSAELFQLLES